MSSSSSSSSEGLEQVEKRVHLVKEEVTEYTQGVTTGYRLRVTCDQSEGMPTEIFVFQRTPGAVGETEPIDFFAGVAKPLDFEEYAVDAIRVAV